MKSVLTPNDTDNKVLKDSLNPFYNKLITQFALENSNIGVWDYHVETNMVYYSKTAKKILNFDSQETDISTFDWKAKIHPEDLDSLLIKLEAHFNNETSNYISEHRVLHKDGSYRWINDSGKIVERDAHGNHTRMIGTISDITKRKLQEEKTIQNLDVITNQNQKLTNFAHIVTHNLKEYSGNFESLLTFYDEAETNEEKEELITHLKSVSESLTKTITDLKEIVSTQSIKKIERENLNIYTYIENVITILDLEIKEKKAVFNNNVDRDIYLYCNSAYLESIIQNIATNALKYAHPDRQPVVNITSSMDTNNMLTISVSDNGLGIDLEKYGDKLFGLYNTFHRNDNAQGVGLYLTKNQIEALGGNIAVESQVNIGTTFHITVDLTENPA